MTETETKKKEEWFYCNDCGRQTLHSMVHNHRNREYSEDVRDDWGNIIARPEGHCDWQMFECGGC
ncbi:MAG TPA: hypothetical protein VHP34_08070, partial [Alphaproteobacteria bacterium]|nr:hypothetical protein [Alphaproteobacteria bacterium]